LNFFPKSQHKLSEFLRRSKNVA